MLARRQRLEVRGLQVHHGGALFSGVVGLGKGLAVHLDTLEGAERRGGTEHQAVIAAGIIRSGLVGAVENGGDRGAVVVIAAGGGSLHTPSIIIILDRLVAGGHRGLLGVGAAGDAAVRHNSIAVRVVHADSLVCSNILTGHLAGERTAGDGKLFIVVVELAFLLILVLIRLQCLIGFGGEAAVLYLNLTKALVAGTVHYGDSRAVLNGAVVFGLIHRAAGNIDGSLVAGDLQTAGADLHAHGLGVDGGIVDGQRAAAREVDAEAVGNVQRAVFQRDAVVRVVAVGLDAARGGRAHFNTLEREARVVIGDRAATCRRNQTHELRADDLAVLHRQGCIGVVDLKRRAVRIRAGAGPGVTIQVYRAVNTAGVKGRAGGVVAQKDDRLAAGSLRLERLLHGVVGGFADHGQIRLRHTEGAVGVLSNAGILHHVLGGIAGKRTAGDSDGSLSGIGDSNQAIVVGIGAQLTIDGATADADLGQLALGFVVTHGRHVTFDGAAFDAQSAVVPVAVRPGRHCAVDRAALDGSSVPVLNGVAVGGVQRAAVQEQIAAIDLDHDEVVLRKRAALDIQAGILCNAVIADTHQRCSLAGRITAVVRYYAALEG